MLIEQRKNSAKNQIAVYSSTVGEAMYTVPSGKIFHGHIAVAGSSSAINIDSVPVYAYLGSYGSSTPIPITLLAGTVVTCGGSSGISLFGIEEDA